VTGGASVTGTEGTTVTNSGSYADFDDAVSVAGDGVTDIGDGTWSWSGIAPDEGGTGYGPLQPVARSSKTPMARSA
jgi:hypothetical protein